jgi:putative ferrous iron transport protein C
MILFELRQFLKEQHTVSLKELCEHFESSEEAMEEMLQIWVRKGYLQTLDTSLPCDDCSDINGSCPKCFRWKN